MVLQRWLFWVIHCHYCEKRNNSKTSVLKGFYTKEFQIKLISYLKNEKAEKCPQVFWSSMKTRSCFLRVSLNNLLSCTLISPLSTTKQKHPFFLWKRKTPARVHFWLEWEGKKVQKIFVNSALAKVFFSEQWKNWSLSTESNIEIINICVNQPFDTVKAFKLDHMLYFNWIQEFLITEIQAN